MQKVILLLVLGFYTALSAQDQTNESKSHQHISGSRHLKDNQHIPKKESHILSNALGVDDYLTLSGHVGLYFQTYSDRDSTLANEEFGNAYAFIKMETQEWNNLTFGIAGLFNGEFHDHNNAFRRAINEKSPILAEIYAKYTLSETTITVGRQGVEWIMLEDFYEGVFIESNDIPGFSLRAAWVNRVATLDPDDLVNWNELTTNNDTDGVYGVELEWNQFESVTLTGLYYSSNGAYSIYGARGEFLYQVDNLSNELLVEFYKTRENDQFNGGTASNGSILHISHTTGYNDFKFGLGFLESAKSNGAGSLLNNPWDVFDEDTHTDLPNSQTWYIAGEYAVTEKLTLKAIYGISNTDNGNSQNSDYKEFNFIVEYNIMDNLDLEAAFIKLDTDDNVSEGYDKVWFNLIYSF